jgi:predicted O-linked N-acetylglucosamine transferase (SPINDLY family)
MHEMQRYVEQCINVHGQCMSAMKGSRPLTCTIFTSAPLFKDNASIYKNQRKYLQFTNGVFDRQYHLIKYFGRD